MTSCQVGNGYKYDPGLYEEIESFVVTTLCAALQTKDRRARIHFRRQHLEVSQRLALRLQRLARIR